MPARSQTGCTAVHNGSNLNYPTITVTHEETSAYGRNWNITYPMDIRNCESCHPKATTSGTWMTNPNRLACSGCHDSDAATAHILANTSRSDSVGAVQRR